MVNIIIGIVFIVGGLTGRLALLGTGSPKAMAVFGLVLMCWGGYQEFRRRAAR